MRPQDASADGAAIERLTSELISLGAADLAADVLASALDLPTAHVDTAAAWVRCRAARRRWGISDRLTELLKRGEIGRRAIIAYVRALGSLGIREGVQHLSEQHGEWLSKDSEGWSAVVDALARTGPKYLFLIWAERWRNHSQADVHALRTVAIALYNEGRFRSARDAVALAYSKADTAELHSQLGVWHATELLLSGQLNAGREVFRRIHRGLLRDEEMVLHRVIRAVLAVQNAGNLNERWRATTESKRLLKRASGSLHPRYAPRFVRRFIRRAIERIARSSFNPFFATWGFVWLYGWIFEKGFLWFVGLMLALMALVFAAMGCWGCLIWPIIFALLHYYYKKRSYQSQTE